MFRKESRIGKRNRLQLAGGDGAEAYSLGSWTSVVFDDGAPLGLGLRDSLRVFTDVEAARLAVPGFLRRSRRRFRGRSPDRRGIELVHNFCEIHDDIQAGKISRNDRDSVWWKWGPAQAINAGDGMHALARLALLGLGERGIGPDRIFEAVKLLDKASLATCEGRFMDLEAQERLDMSSGAYLDMAAAKAGSVYSCAMEFGALAAGGDSATRESFADAGRELGIAVQIAEDMRQLASATSADAAPSEDFMNKKKLYPVVRAFEIASPAERRRLGDYYFKRVLEPSDARNLSETISGLGVNDYAAREIASRVTRATDIVRSVLPAAEDADGLCDLIRYVAGEA